MVSLDARILRHSEYGSALGNGIDKWTQTVLCSQEAKPRKMMTWWLRRRRQRGGKNFCHISIVSGPVKQSGTRCYENVAFHLAHTPENEFSRRLLSCLVCSSIIICTQVSILRGVHPPVYLPRTHKTPAKDRPLGNTKLSRRVDVIYAAFLPDTHMPSHQKNTGATPGLLTICLLCPPSATRSSEDNRKFWIGQLAEPSTELTDISPGEEMACFQVLMIGSKWKVYKVLS